MFIILRGDGFVGADGQETDDIDRAMRFVDAQSAYRMARESDRVDLAASHEK
jgi:hypothetical protein